MYPKGGNVTEHKYVAHGLIQLDGDVLLLHRADGRYLGNFWDIPGGTVEPGESPSEAAVRECREEAGINCMAAQEIAHFKNMDTEGRDIIFHTLTYNLHPVSDTTVQISPEHQDYRWATPADALQLPLVPHVKQTLQTLIANSGTARSPAPRQA